jgi:translocation and assembly module TamB
MASMVIAQTKDQSYFENLLQDVLSSPSMDVTITGLTGTLSSKGRVERIEISDSLGKWLVIEDAEIDWTRSALLRKRVEIQTLTANKIIMYRTPKGDNSDVQFEASEFNVPELPVAVGIDNITANKVILRPPVLGRSAEFTLKGGFSYANGNLNGDMNASFTDDSGAFQIKTNYDTTEKTIDLDLQVREQANGLIVNLLDIPEKPSIEMGIQGNGPINQFVMDLTLKTDNELRISGTVIAEPVLDAAEVTGTRFVADVDGALSPLFQPAYRPFFGDTATLLAEVERLNSGETTVSGLNLETAALKLGGEITLASDGAPQFIDIKARLNDPDNKPLLLPFAGAETRVTSASLELDYTAGEPWRSLIDIKNLDRSGLSAQNIALIADGTLAPSFLQTKPSDLLISSDIRISATGLEHTDSDIDRAIGKSIDAKALLEMRKDSFLKISELSVDNKFMAASLDGTISGYGSGFEMEGKLDIQGRDLSPLSGVLGQSIAGNGQIDAIGNLVFLTGAFNFDVSASLQSISTGTPILNEILFGNNSASFNVQRTTQGIELSTLQFNNPQISGVVDATLKTNASAATITAKLNDAAAFLPGITGPMELTGSAQQSGDRLNLNLTTSGIGGVRAQIDGSIPVSSGAWDLNAKGTAPLALLDQFLVANSAKANGTSTFDLNLQGTPSLQALSGNIRTENANFVLPSQQITLSAIQANISVASGLANVRLNANASSGGTISVTGPISLDPNAGFPADLSLTLRNVRQLNRSFYTARANGDLRLSGPVTNGPDLTGRIEILEAEVNIAAAPQPTLQFAPAITHKNEPVAVRTTRKNARLIKETSTGGSSLSTPINLDILIDAPTRVFIRGRGLDAELGGRLRIEGTPRALRPNGGFQLIRGRMNILGRRFDITEGTMSLNGSFDPLLYIVVQSTVNEFDTSIIISGQVTDPKFSFESTPDLPQDEILAQMVFGRNLENISPFQAVQLASSIRELSGRGGIGFVNRIRTTLRLDDFTIETDEDGEVGLKLGKYVSKNAYTDVTIAGRDKSKVTLNLDIQKNLTLRSTLEETGNGSVGLFFEKDY